MVSLKPLAAFYFANLIFCNGLGEKEVLQEFIGFGLQDLLDNNQDLTSSGLVAYLAAL